MNEWHSYYSTDTGLFVGRAYNGQEEFADANAPEGCAWVKGRYSPACWRVNLATGAAEEYTPPPPTAEQVAAALRVESLAKIAALEATQPRAIREAVLTGDKARLQSIEAQIQTLRGDLA